MKKAVILAIDAGTSYIKTAQLQQNNKGEWDSRGNSFLNGKPCPSDVRIRRDALVRVEPPATRGRHLGPMDAATTDAAAAAAAARSVRLDIRHGMAGSKRNWVTLRNTKRFFFKTEAEVDKEAAAQDLGFAAEAGIADEAGYLGIKVAVPRAQDQPVWLNDVFAAIIGSVLKKVADRKAHFLAGLAITMPVDTSTAARKTARALVQMELAKLPQLWGPGASQPPPVAIVPESLAAHQNVFRDLAPGTRAVVIDMGHGTLDVTIATVRDEGPSDVISSGDFYAGVKNLADKVLDLVVGKLQRSEGGRAWLQGCSSLDDDDENKVAQMKQLLDYVEAAVEAASAAECAEDAVSDDAMNERLCELAPVAAGEVWAAAERLGRATEECVERALLINQQCGLPPPSHAQLVGGGALIPAVSDGTMRAVGPSTQLFRSEGGNKDLVATGAAWLMLNHLRQQGLVPDSSAAAQAAPSTKPPTGSPSAGPGSSSNLDALWQVPLGRQLAVWTSFSVEEVLTMSLPQLQWLQRSCFAAHGEVSVDGRTIVPDTRRRLESNRLLQRFIADRIQGQQQQGRPAYQFTRARCDQLAKRYSPIYLVMADSSTSLPWGPTPYPYKLCSPDGTSSITLRLVLLDPLQIEEDVVAGDFEMPSPPAHAWLCAHLSLDADRRVSCTAESVLPGSGAPGSAELRQQHPVNTRFDQFAAQRHSQQQRMRQLSPAAQSFLAQTLADTPAVPAASPAAKQQQRPPRPAGLADSLHLLAAAAGCDAEVAVALSPRKASEQQHKQVSPLAEARLAVVPGSEKAKRQKQEEGRAAGGSKVQRIV